MKNIDITLIGIESISSNDRLTFDKLDFPEAHR